MKRFSGLLLVCLVCLGTLAMPAYAVNDVTLLGATLDPSTHLFIREEAFKAGHTERINVNGNYLEFTCNSGGHFFLSGYKPEKINDLKFIKEAVKLVNNNPALDITSTDSMSFTTNGRSSNMETVLKNAGKRWLKSFNDSINGADEDTIKAKLKEFWEGLGPGSQESAAAMKFCDDMKRLTSNTDWGVLKERINSNFPPPITEESAQEQTSETRDGWVKTLQQQMPSASKTFEDWVKAAQLKHEGIAVPGYDNISFYTQDNLTSLQQLQIAAIFYLPNSKVPEGERPTLQPGSTTDTATGNPGIAEEVAATALNEFKEAQALADDTVSMAQRLLTFPSRVKYLTNMCQITGEVDQTIISYINDPTMSQYFYPEVGYVSSPLLTNVRNSEAYTALVATVTEMSYHSTILVKQLAENTANKNFDSMQSTLKQLLSLKEGLDYLNSTQAWSMWAKTFDLGDNPYNSLEKIYNELVAQSAFDGLDSYDVTAVGKPFAQFFDMGSRKLSANVLEGVATSSMYLPMQTNLYDPMTVKMSDSEEFIKKFHYNYGFHRKALYIDTNVDAAVDFYRTGRVGTLKVATLKDLMYADKDIVLYIDDNFYNVNQLAELQGKALDRLDNVDSESTTNAHWWNGLWERAKGLFDMDILEITKTAEKTRYSQKIRNKIDEYNENETEPPSGNFNQYLLNSAEIKGYLSLTTDEAANYSVMQSFAVISGIYRDFTLFDSVAEYLNANHPVFISSPTLPCIAEADRSAKNAIYNYLLIKNLKANTPIGYSTNLDMTSPLYMDIYGNISTESGLVVIPAASNATLHESTYSPLNAGFLSTYGDSYKLPTSFEGLDEIMSKFFEPVDRVWELKSIQNFSGEITASMLSTGSKETLLKVKDLYSFDLSKGTFKFSNAMNNILEVLRGAPIESIDKNFEGLNTSMRLDRNGLIMAAKLEQLVESLGQKDVNTTLKIPNLAFIDGVEYVVLFAFKIIMLVIIIIWMVTIYIDAVGGTLSWKTIGKCLGILSLVMSLIVVVPIAFDLTYYQSNKILLQKETEQLQMLNLEKVESGAEIGITEVGAPDISTNMYLKLDDIKAHWYDIFSQVLVSSTFDSLEQVYKDYNESNFISGKENIETMNDAVYISANSLFSSSSIAFSPTTGNLYQTQVSGTAASFYTPYYAFLDSILTTVNEYNRANNIYAYSTKIQRGGKVKTIGMINAYFNSAEFTDDPRDVLGLYEMYGITAPYTEELPMYTEDALSKIRQSQWCNQEISTNQIEKRIEAINIHMREYIAENKELIGKVTDETFLKSMALHMAMYHNKVFNTQRADCLEIYNLSNEDLMRMSIASKNQVISNSPLSFARFVYETGGTPAVYAAAMYSVVAFISSWIKPLATIAVFLLVFFSIFVFKIILRNKTKSYYGYICTILLICGMNIVHSILLKLSMYLPNLGLTPTVCIIVQMVLQVLYMVGLLWVIVVAAKDWRNLGFTHHTEIFDRFVNKRQYETAYNYGPRHVNGWEYYNDLVDKQRRRTGDRSYRQTVRGDRRE